VVTGSAVDDRVHLQSADPMSRRVLDELPCRVHEADLWFGETPADLERAKAFCQDCPVRAACLFGALERLEPWGVWGGEIIEQGAVVARKRSRGRPRKGDAVAA
jgi:WhiB family redox-sensing transcriptional regulator